MLKCELMDGTTRYFGMDRVVLLNQREGGGLLLKYVGPEDKVKSIQLKRFQLVKQGTWYD